MSELDGVAGLIPSVSSSSYPRRDGNRVRPLVDGLPAFTRINEAIEAAGKSVWATIAFQWEAFEMPDGGGPIFDVLDRAVARGIDVRLLYWRHDTETGEFAPNLFWGSMAQRAQLDARRSGLRIRWDRAHPGFCQHQKSWLIDAGEEGEVAFVGGINLNPHSVVAPGHDGDGHNHDAYVEIAGPSAVDVHHNFVQRWNEASDRTAPDGMWGGGAEVDLPFPTRTPREQGDAAVQIQRTINRGRYRNGHPSVEAPPYDIATGERSILEQYVAALGAAQRSVYIENQHLEVAEIVSGLRDALERGVDVVVLVPGQPDVSARAANRPGRVALLDERAALGRYPSFTMAGIANNAPNGERRHIYVHAKLMLIDDAWATIGSANLHGWSLFGNSEMNASFWDRAVVRALRDQLFEEHLGVTTAHLDDRAAVQLFGEVARQNQESRGAALRSPRSLAFSLDPATYGR